MPAVSNTNDRERIPIRMDRFLATIDLPASRALDIRRLLADVLRDDDVPVGHLIEVGDDERLSMDGRRWDPGEDQTLSDQLIYVLMQASLDEDVDRLHLHAALVGAEGRGLLIGGVSGSGKSTLVAQLVADGFEYFTDERVAVDAALHLGPLPKPISLAYPGSGPLAHLEHLAAQTGSATHRLWHLPAGDVRPGSIGTAVPPLAAIALVEYRSGALFEAVALHPVTVARVLLTDSIDADRYGADGPLLVTRLCASVPCVSAVHGGGPDVLGFLRSLAAGDAPQVGPTVAAEVVSIEGGRRPAWKGAVRFGPSSVVGRARGIHGALANDRTLVRTAQGAVVELDETLTAWFLLLDGMTALGDIVREVAVEVGVDAEALAENAVAIVGHLASLGVAA